MPNLGTTEIIIIALVIVVLFGSKKLPDAARSIGRSLRIFKAETKGLRNDDEAAQAPQAPAPAIAPAPAPVPLDATPAPASPQAQPAPVVHAASAEKSADPAPAAAVRTGAGASANGAKPVVEAEKR